MPVLDVAVGLEYPNNSESYTGRTIATSRATEQDRSHLKDETKHGICWRRRASKRTP
jgi:hypothetical protein